MRIQLGVAEGNEIVTVFPSAMVEKPRTIVYHTGAGETARVLSDSNNEKREIFAALSNSGYLVTSVTSSKDHWGSPVSLKAHDGLFRWIRSECGVNKVAILCQSMGGLSAYNWACRNPKLVLGVYGIYPATNLTAMLRGPIGPAIVGIYRKQGIDLQAKISVFDPIRQIRSLAREGVPAKHRHGDADLVVEYEPNAVRFAHAYASAGGRFELVTVRGLGHQVDPCFFNAEEVVEFMDSLEWGD